jgi:predicted PurR-regulated permease PerM|tara:strand:- start:2840 stop:3139 length:300 start_codon:yes stop_codon:yes gene_type:complete
MDPTLIIGIIVFIEGIVILMALKELSTQIQEGLEDLDSNLGTVIKNIVENYVGQSDINPIQQAFASLIQNSIKQPSRIIETVPRDLNSGQFSTQNKPPE